MAKTISTWIAGADSSSGLWAGDMKLDLSKRRHYTFPALASRLECSVDDLRYFVLEGELIPSRFLESGTYLKYQMEPNEDYETTGHVVPYPMRDADDPNDAIQRGWLNGFHYLVLPNRTGSNQCEFSFAATLPSGFDLGDIIYELVTSMSIDDVMNTGVVMAVELDRFEAMKSGKGTPAGLEKPLGDRERENLLNIIGALLELIKSPKENRDSNAAVIKEMLANYSDKPGIKGRTLEQKFAAATRSLQSR